MARKNKNTVLFPGVWEQINNPAFNSPEFEGIRNKAGRNSFYLEQPYAPSSASSAPR